MAALAAGQSANAASASQWDGVYVGGVLGATFSNGHFSLPGDTADTLLSDHSNKTGFTGGGLIGFNHQFDEHYVVGIEGDVVDGSDTLNVDACTKFGGCWTPAHDSFTTHNRVNEGLGGHVRVRLGYAAGRTLFYAAGGYSIASAQLKLIGDCYDPNNPSTPTVYRYQRDQTLSGFNVGAGVESLVTNHVALRAEYIYDDFGDQTFKGDGVEWNDRRVSLDSSTVRVGASYRF